MHCPACHYQDTRVYDSRLVLDGFAIRRRRECPKCKFRFSTYEQIELLNLVVVKKDNRREPYQREKLERGIRKACEKRPISEEQIKRLIFKIEREIQSIGGAEISSQKIGQIVMKYLKKLDKVAYIRFASVYKAFTDVDAFKEELKKLSPKSK